MARHLLTLNAGSSSVKFALFEVETLECLAIGQVDGLGADPHFKVKDGSGRVLAEDALEGEHAIGDHAGALAIVLSFFATAFPALDIAAVGHRVVHGGLAHSGPVLLDATRLAELAALAPLAPLHQPHNLSGVAAAQAAFPGRPQVACFDTAFHRGQSFVNQVYAIPRAFYDEGVRRYGFHGLSCDYIVRELARIAPDSADGRVVICHLGSGASMCAVHHGRSVASSMGFSPLDGLPMGTRPGQIDSGVLLYLMDHKQMSAQAISDLLYRRCGLLGLSEISGDMRLLEASDDPRAHQAIAHFVSRVRRELGAMAAVLEGLDAIVFCGGIGENAHRVRAAVLEGMAWMGIAVDADRNRAAASLISAEMSRVQVFVIKTNEELVIAEQTVRTALA